MLTINEVRSTFLEYFSKLDHTPVPSSPLVPVNDPTLLFTNAGMVQFKNVFTGIEKRPYKRACSSQKCVRVGGKHNDLDNVGFTARHHTFFEMLGNFSFADYFKEFAIEHAWNLITNVLGLDRSRLLVTIYHSDEEAYNLWRKIASLPDSKIIRIATDDNFWRMADTGPCGPSSEIFYDHGEHIEGGPPGSPNEDGDRFVEIWNLVFMQFNQLSSTEQVPLPTPCIDTGIGLERLSAALQGKNDNYDTDMIRSLILASADISGVEPDGEWRSSHRVIADHLRSSAFLIADGVVPSNEGRGYALRRIMRRAMRHAHMLGCKDPMMHRLVPTLIGLMGNHYGELGRNKELITETLKIEEIRFKKTLGHGLRLLEEETGNLSADQALPGAVAFKLYDTFGFPLDLTQDVLRGTGRKVDVDGFNVAMDEQRRKARESWVGSGEQATEAIWFALRDEFKSTEFLGNETTVAEGKVLALLDLDHKRIDEAKVGEFVLVLLNQTPFYGESGGQVGDVGVISNPNCRIEISETQRKLGALTIHVGKVIQGKIGVNDILSLAVNGEIRKATCANHSVTHLLHAALRERIGNHVAQKGSLVTPERMRFDVSYSQPMATEDLEAVEAEVNARIRENTEVSIRFMSIQQANDVGAMALFGEKYGDEVRVITMGGKKADDVTPYSIELCGGTHVRRTGDIGVFKIVSEGAVAANVRRIEALTGRGALAYIAEMEHIAREASGALSVKPQELPQRLQSLLAERRKSEREIVDLRRQIALGVSTKGQASEQRTINGVQFIARIMEGVPAKEMRPLADTLKNQIDSGIIVLIGVNEGKVAILVKVTQDLTSRFNAVQLVNIGVTVLGGRAGGGRPDLAQAGGPDTSSAPQALEAIEKAIADAAPAA